MPDTDNPEHPAHKKHVPPDGLSRLDEQALQVRLKKIEQDFYWIRHGRPAETRLSHQELEREWNDLKASIALKQGKDRVYKHDRRDEFSGEIRQLATNKLSYGNWERNGAPIDMSLVRAHRARNLRAQSFKQLLNIERQTLVIERTTALVQRRLDELPMNHPRRIPLQAKLNFSEQKRLQLQARSETARQEYSRATRLFHARVNKLPAEEQRALRQAILERETTLALRLSGKTDSPTTRAGMQTLLAVNAERRVSAGTAAVDAFRTAYAADLSKPVHERILMPGEKLVRYAHPTARLGQSYTTPGTAADRSGISPEVARPRQTYIVRHQVKALEFNTAPTVDTWTLKNSQGKSLGSYTGSGATEIRIPRESVNRALKKMPRVQASKSGTVILQKGKLRQFASKTRAKRPSSTLKVRKPKA